MDNMWSVQMMGAQSNRKKNQNPIRLNPAIRSSHPGPTVKLTSGLESSCRDDRHVD